jgi:hypothetical protein
MLPAGLIPLVVAALAALQLLVFWPGVVAPDSVAQYGQALSGHYEDWHPPIMAFLWRQLGRLAPGQAPFLVLLALLYWSGAALLAQSLRRRNRPRSALAVLAILAVPIAFGEMGSVIKDSLLTACCLAAVGLATHGGRPARLIALALLTVAAATRFNAGFAAAPLLVWLLPARWQDDRWRVAGLILVALALFGASSWLINQEALAPRRTHPMTSLVGFDLAGIVAHGGRPSLLPTSRMSATLLARCYTPAQFNPHYREDCDQAQDGLASAAAGGLTRNWLLTILDNPVPWMRHRLAHLNVNWRFLLPRVPDDAIYIMPAPANDLGLTYHPSRAAIATYRAASLLAASPLGRPASWLAVAAALVFLSPALRCRRAVTALSLSALLYGGAYAIVSVAPDLRYNLWTMLAAALALALAAPDLAAAPRRHLSWSCGAVGAVMLLEMIWLVLRLPPPP